MHFGKGVHTCLFLKTSKLPSSVQRFKEKNDRTEDRFTKESVLSGRSNGPPPDHINRTFDADVGAVLRVDLVDGRLEELRLGLPDHHGLAARRVLEPGGEKP